MPKPIGQTPHLEIFDMAASVAFYRKLLGCEVVFASPEVEMKKRRFSHFVILRRDKFEIMLNTAYDFERAAFFEKRSPLELDYRPFVDCDDVGGPRCPNERSGTNRRSSRPDRLRISGLQRCGPGPLYDDISSTALSFRTGDNCK